MARVSKLAWRDFEYNLRKARGLVRLQFYAEDLIETGGKESIGKLMAFIGDMMASFGFEDLVDFQKLIEGKVTPILEKELAPLLEKRLAAIDQRKLESAAKELEAKLLPRIDEFRAIFDEIVLVVERVLLEQALVTAVTALEVYLSDVTVDAVAKNRFLQKRFSDRLHDRFEYVDVANVGWDLELALGKVVAEAYTFYKPQSVAKHLRTLLDENAPLHESRERAELSRILAYRNLIVHRAGLVDRSFRRQTGYRGNIEEPVAIRRDFVEAAIRFCYSVASRVQVGLENLRARG